MSNEKRAASVPPKRAFEAKLFVDGKRIPDARQEDADHVEHLVDGSLESDEDGEVLFGFSTIAKREVWIGKQSRQEQAAYHGLQKMLDRARKSSDLTDEEKTAIEAAQTERLRFNSAQFEALLKRNGVREFTPEKLVPLLVDFDPLYGSNSMLLFRWYDFEDWMHFSLPLVLSTGVYWNLGWWRNRMSSYINPDGAFWMFKNRYLTGGDYQRLYPKVQPHVSSSWQNQLESIIYGSYGFVLEFF